jgi:hypothetical protein
MAPTGSGRCRQDIAHDDLADRSGQGGRADAPADRFGRASTFCAPRPAGVVARRRSRPAARRRSCGVGRSGRGRAPLAWLGRRGRGLVQHARRAGLDRSSCLSPAVADGRCHRGEVRRAGPSGDPCRPRPEIAPGAGDRAATRLDGSGCRPGARPRRRPDHASTCRGARSHLRGRPPGKNGRNEALVSIDAADPSLCWHLVSGNPSPGERTAASHSASRRRHARSDGRIAREIGACSVDGIGAEILVTNAQGASIRQDVHINCGSARCVGGSDLRVRVGRSQDAGFCQMHARWAHGNG